MMIKIFAPALTVILLATGASPVTAQQVDKKEMAAELYNRGNAAFRDKDYKTAQNLYLRVANEVGIKNSALFNNIATAYMMSGETGKAVLYYKRALRLSPRDDMIQENLARAVDAKKDRIAGPDSTAPFGKFLTHYSYITLNEHAFILLFLITILGAAILHARIKGRPPLNSRLQMVLAVAVILQTLLLSTKTIYMSRMKEGVVLGETVTVRSGPNIDSERLFEIHSGIECLILSSEKGYIEIQLSTGWKGWVSHQFIEII